MKETINRSSDSKTPVYLRIAQAISRERSDISTAIKLASEEELAKRHHVTRTTLRRAMEFLEKEGAISRRQGHGTFLHPLNFKAPLAAGSAVGFIYPWWVESINSWYAATVFDGVHKWADERDCQVNILRLGRQGEGSESLHEKIANRKVSGLIWVHPATEQIELLKTISRQIPCVVVGRELEYEGICAVTPDYEQVVAHFHDFLVSRGHQHYAVLSKNLSDSYHASWFNALQTIHKQRKIPFDSHEYYIDIAPFPRPRLAELIQDFYLPAHPEVTALVLASSTYLLPLLASEKFRSQIGEKISIVAFDYGIQAMHTYQPGLDITHVTCDWPAIGGRAMGMLFSCLQGNPVPKMVREPVRLVEGSTVKDLTRG